MRTLAVFWIALTLLQVGMAQNTTQLIEQIRGRAAGAKEAADLARAFDEASGYLNTSATAVLVADSSRFHDSLVGMATDVTSVANTLESVARLSETAGETSRAAVLRDVKTNLTRSADYLLIAASALLRPSGGFLPDEAKNALIQSGRLIDGAGAQLTDQNDSLSDTGRFFRLAGQAITIAADALSSGDSQKASDDLRNAALLCKATSNGLQATAAELLAMESFKESGIFLDATSIKNTNPLEVEEYFDQIANLISIAQDAFRDASRSAQAEATALGSVTLPVNGAPPGVNIFTQTASILRSVAGDTLIEADALKVVGRKFASSGPPLRTGDLRNVNTMMRDAASALSALRTSAPQAPEMNFFTNVGGYLDSAANAFSANDASSGIARLHEVARGLIAIHEHL